jgi:anti-sigma factor ChrR (cupin superfamily)
MELNADFTKRAVVHGARTAWVSSPIPGVERRMLDRVGDEVARATTIVRYAPNSRFSPHTHDGGEEFLVLEGVFQDEHGDFPVGSYIRNPPASRHTPGSAPGCTIFVKLWQFDPNDKSHVRIDTNKMRFVPASGRLGVEMMPLFHSANEDVRLERWVAGSKIMLSDPAGIECFVLRGGFDEGNEQFAAQSWLRLPPGESAGLKVGNGGCEVWIKSGHLAHTPTFPRASG